MSTQKKALNLTKLSLTLLLIIPFYGACGVIDSIMPSSSAYRVSATIDGQSINDISIISPSSNIQPFFENVSFNDPDVTSLAVYLKNSGGDIAGWRVIYNTRNHSEDQVENTSNEDTSNEAASYNEEEANEDTDNEENVYAIEEPNHDERIIRVRNFNQSLPYFPIPENLPMGRYTLVFEVMSGNRTLHRNERSLFNLAGTEFSFGDIQIHQSGIAANPQQISMHSLVMLEAKVNYDTRLDPYIVWYNGRRVIAEGHASEGMRYLLWRAPEQTGFYSVRAEVFPVRERQGLMGLSRTISLLVSSRRQEVNLISSDTPDVLQWYVLEGNLENSASPPELSAGSEQVPQLNTARSLRPLNSVSARWLAANGTYGLAAGAGRAYSPPAVNFSESTSNSFSILSRIKPSGDSVIFSAAFDSSAAMMTLSTQENNLILTLESPEDNSSTVIDLQGVETFINVRVNFTVFQNRLLANLSVNSSSINTDSESFSIRADIKDSFLLTLGSQHNDETAQNLFTIWDELVIFSVSFIDFHE